jgi:hypothetical protein
MNYLNEDPENKFTWQTIVQALTDPNKVLNFPIKYPAIEFDKPTKNMFYYTAAIISVGIIIGAVIKKK